MYPIPSHSELISTSSSTSTSSHTPASNTSTNGMSICEDGFVLPGRVNSFGNMELLGGESELTDEGRDGAEDGGREVMERGASSQESLLTRRSE